MVETYWLLLCCAWLSAATPLAPASEQRVAVRSSGVKTRVVADTHLLRVAADSAAAHDLVQLRISEFNALWQRVWRDSERYRQRFQATRTMDSMVRVPYQHCHSDNTLEPGAFPNQGMEADSIDRVQFLFRVIKSKHSYYATCPSWLLSRGVELALDENLERDGALLDSLRPAVHAARAALLAELDSSAHAWPSNVWLTGQRVRLHLDQRDRANALAAATSCQGASWWCSALVGFVHERTGNIQKAELSYAQMHAAMPADVACNWDDVRNLLDASERGSYGSLDCQQRAQLNAKFWWLADPLLRTASNERRVADDSRRVEIELHRAVGYDERYTWITDAGGDALSQLVERYGWPVYTANMLVGYQESNHTAFLNSTYGAGHDGPRMAPYTTFEYTMDRVHTVPSWKMMEEPFRITDTSWTLRAESPDGSPITKWWPSEHYFSDRPLVQLFEGQTGMFRRQSHILVSAALQLKHPELKTGPRAQYDVMMLTSTGPGQLDSLAQTADTAGGTVVLQGLVTSAPRLIAIEALGARNTGVNARSRFGLAPPLPLDSMKPGEIAVSDPVFLAVQPNSDQEVPSEDMLAHMLGSTRLGANSRRLRVYWESYGITAKDTVKVFVRVVGDRELSVARRLAMALNVADSPNGEVVQEWTEPDVQRGTRTLDGQVPVQQRSIVLTLAEIEPGPYIIEVGVQRKNGTVASGKRRITIQP